MNIKVKAMQAKRADVLSKFLSEHPEMKPFVAVFWDISNSDNSTVKISIGKRLDNDYFHCDLTSVVDNPRINFAIYDSLQISDIPQVIVRTKKCVLAAFTLDIVEDIELITAETKTTKQHNAMFTVSCDGVSRDYSLTATIRKEQE